MCPKILTYLLQAPQLMMTELVIYDFEVLNEVNCSRLGKLVQVSTNVKKLKIDLCIEAPERVAVGISAARHLQSLLWNGWNHTQCKLQHQRAISEMIVASGDGGHEAVARLLQDPHSQLKNLNISSNGLDDDQFIAILHLMTTSTSTTTSRLEKLNVSYNNIRTRGILEFARCLPLIKCLKVIRLLEIPWQHDSKSQQVCGAAALLQAMMHNAKHLYNTSVEKIDFSFEFPMIHDLQYYYDLNHAGRKILLTSHPVPLGLWPRLLERAEEIMPYTRCEERRANAVFFYCRIVQYHHSTQHHYKYKYRYETKFTITCYLYLGYQSQMPNGCINIHVEYLCFVSPL